MKDNDPKIIGGQGTIGLELESQLEGIDSVFCPVGGGGLAAGIAGYLKSSDAQVRFVYYQPVELDTGVGRYVYPLEPGGGDDGRSFWTNAGPAGDLTVDLELKSAWPVRDVRMPGWQGQASTTRHGDGHLEVHAVLPDDAMDQDLVLYYRLADDLPGLLADIYSDHYRESWPQAPEMPPELVTEDVLAALAVSSPFAMYLRRASTVDDLPDTPDSPVDPSHYVIDMRCFDDAPAKHDLLAPGGFGVLAANGDRLSTVGIVRDGRLFRLA